MKKLLIILFFGFFICHRAYSQNRIVLKVVSENLTKNEKKMVHYKAEHPDSISALLELKNLIFRIRQQSYLLASSDSIYKRGDTLYSTLSCGPSWKWTRLKAGNLPSYMLSKSNFKEKFYCQTTFNYPEVVKLQEEIIDYAEQHGFPFATIHLDSIYIDKENIVATLNYLPGPSITFDSIRIVGNTKIKSKFLLRYLKIIPGQVYDQEKINQVDKLLKELPYVKQTRPMAIIFNQNKAIVNLFLEDRKANHVDGIIGILPNESAGKKLLVTGELTINLKNLLGTGKSFVGEWKKFDQASQLLNLTYIHPRVLRSNLDGRVDFNLFKQDTSFLNISRKITIAQAPTRFGKFNFQGGLKTSRELLSGKTKDKSALPPFSSYNYYIYGLGYDWNNLNDIFYPHNGWNVSTQGLIGNKSILRSPGFEDSLYKNIELKSVQLNISLTIERYLRIGKKGVFVARAEGGHLLNKDNNLFLNDMLRVGGLKSLRGFNENNFYAKSFGIGTLEYRFFTDETSYLLLFFDQGYIKNPLNTTIPVDYPFGLGAGISFTTNVGVFSFIYSLGNAKSQPLQFNLSKIHFGMVSRF